MPLTDDDVRRLGRRLRDLVEPLAANVYFAPECHEAYRRLGFAGSSGERGGLHLPDGPAYFTSRGASLGPVPGEVVAAAFGVFNPAVVVPCVAFGWQVTTRDAVLAARQEGATASLRRILGAEPAGLARATELLRRAADTATGEGRHLFSGLRSLGFPGDPMGDLWRACDLVREHRGDSHVCAWVAAGTDPVEIGLLTELWWRLPMRTYVFTRGWSPEQVDDAAARLEARGLLAGDAFTPAGEAFRGDIEAATDRQERRIVQALGDDADELFGLLQPWALAVVEAHGYPGDPSAITRP